MESLMAASQVARAPSLLLGGQALQAMPSKGASTVLHSARSWQKVRAAPSAALFRRQAGPSPRSPNSRGPVRLASSSFEGTVNYAESKRDEVANAAISNSSLFGAELVGTFILVFLATGVGMVTNATGALASLIKSIVPGLAVMSMAYCTSHISGGHLNPAVTLALAATQKLAWNKVPIYAVAQTAGATLASLTLRSIFGLVGNLGATVPSGDPWQSFAVEFVATFILMFAVSAMATDDRAEGSMAGVVLGAIITTVSLIGGGISGASLNPARSLGPAIVASVWDDIWVYLAGPVLGALTGAGVYRLIA